MLGLGYLPFVDCLIVWFGNLVGFYVARTQPLPGLLATLALALGIGIGSAIVARATGGSARRAVAACALAGIAIFKAWWLGLELLGSLTGMVIVATASLLTRSAAHGSAVLPRALERAVRIAAAGCIAWFASLYLFTFPACFTPIACCHNYTASIQS